MQNYQLACRSPVRNGELGAAFYVYNKVTQNICNPQSVLFQSTVLQLHFPDNKMITINNIISPTNIMIFSISPLS